MQRFVSFIFTLIPTLLGASSGFAQNAARSNNSFPSQTVERASGKVNEAKELIENVQNSWERFTSAEVAAFFRFQAQESGSGMAAIFCDRETNSCERLGREQGYSEAELSFLE